MRTNCSYSYPVMKIFFYFLFFIIAYCIRSEAKAGVEIATNRLSSCNQLFLPNSTLHVVDDKFPSAPNIGFQDKSIQNKITLGVDYECNKLVNPFTVKVNLQIDWKDLQSSYSITKELQIKYDRDANTTALEDKEVYLFVGGYDVTVKILSVRNANNQNIVAPANIYLESEIASERYYRFDPTTVPSNISHHEVMNGGTFADELDISWNFIQGAEEYELEWAYANDYDYDFVNKKAVTIQKANLVSNFDFRNNATHIKTPLTHYQIPLTYESGYILYRYRAVGRSVSDLSKFTYSPWSAPETGKVSTFTNFYKVSRPHQQDGKNWQFSASYAEQGKASKSLSYSDGMMKDHQQVDKLNTTGKAVVSEKIYDYNGRPAIRVLPVPAGNAFQFYDNFNINNAGTAKPFSSADFDRDPTTGPCVAQSNPMKNTSGASNYYSSANPNKTEENAYIPDAGQFPYVQTEFTPDNTGRVKRQTGLGPNYKMDSGHETKYLYGEPFQEELDRLFGSEVGLCNHYRKTVVTDGNGQASVSYTDMNDRVIATALAGDAPATMDAIATADLPLTVDLFNKNENGLSELNAVQNDRRSINFSKNVLVEKDGDYTFDYSITAAAYTDACLNNMCYDCVYDVELSIKDQCFTELVPSGERVGHVGKPTLNTDCDNPSITFPASPTAFKLTLKKGIYAVTKKLKINEDAYNYYVQNYTDPDKNPCLKKYKQFEDEEISKVDLKGCAVPCTQCPSADDLPTPTKVGFNMLLADVSPGGQYGLCYDANGKPVNNPSDVLSVYKEHNQLPGNITNLINWRHPQITANGSVKNEYRNADGKPSLIKVSLLASGAYSPAVLSGKTPVNGFIKPEELANVTDFINNWKSSWAMSLVEYHPEYGYYKWNVLMNQHVSQGRNSDQFDYYLNSLTTFNDAQSQGLFANDPEVQDPFFNGGIGGVDIYNEMANRLSVYVTDQATGFSFSLKEFAAVTNRCGSAYGGALPDPDCTLFGNSTDEDLLNAEWTTYRSAYLSEKERLKTRLADQYVLTTSPSFNGCIEAKNFNPLSSAMAQVTGSDPIHDANQACSQNTYLLYKNKIKRFRNSNDVMNLGTDVSGDPKGTLKKLKEKADFETYKESGQCPIATQLQTLLEGLKTKNVLGQSLPLYNVPQFSKEIFDALNLVVSSQQYQWNGMINGKQMVGSFQADNGSEAGRVELNFPAASIYDWTSTIVKLDRLKFISQAGKDYAFTLLATINSGNTITTVSLTGVTTLPVGNCTMQEQCKPNAASLDLFVALSAMAQQNDLGNAFSMSKYSNYITAELSPYFGNADLSYNGNLLPDMLSFRMIGSNPSVSFSVQMSDPSGLSPDFSGIRAFGSLSVDANTPANFTISAFFSDGSVHVLQGSYRYTNFEKKNFFFLDCQILEPMEAYKPCPGSDLVANGNFEQGQVGIGKTDYTFTSGCPRKDQYTITTNEGGLCSQEPWYLLDHTTGSGQYLAVGPSDLTTKVVWSQAVTVLPKTYYQFTTWVNNLMMERISGQPNSSVVLQINNDVLPLTLQIPYYKQEWRKLTNRWYSGDKTTVLLKIIVVSEYATDGFAIDDISFKGNCPPDTIPVFKTIPITSHTNPCIKQKMDLARTNAKVRYEQYLIDLTQTFKKAYIDHCLSPFEKFTLSFTEKEFNYTLYYYDRAGNLIKTVPPLGVVPVTDPVDFASIKADRKNKTHTFFNKHDYITSYIYNTLNQLELQKTPDADYTQFWYDFAGRLVLSQNSKQSKLVGGNCRYSYTTYDALGRITEVGEISSPITQPSLDNKYLNNVDFPLYSGYTITKSQQTKTIYDVTTCPATVLNQQNLRGRVAAVEIDEDADGKYEYATHYSYDMHGNVKTLIQENPALKLYANNYKRVDYDYDIVSGNVNAVHYQKGANDEFNHKYEYDLDNRLTNVYTSKEGREWKQDAKYFYYLHGPLSRVELGQNKVQGIDYAYTLQGWLKGVNSNSLVTTNDIGSDGRIRTGLNANIPADEYGFTLGYNGSDYTSISTTANAFATAPGTAFKNGISDLFNGNISHSITAINPLLKGANPQGAAYRYDQLNRIKNVKTYSGNAASTNYAETFSYDNNGNISSATRNGANGAQIDNITYKYENNLNGFVKNTDHLLAAEDKISGGVNDIPTGQKLNTSLKANNYVYDDIGNLTSDVQEEISNIEWNVYGKITKITRLSTSKKSDLEFHYDGNGNRICKIVKPRTASGSSKEASWSYTYYVRDAAGNVLSVYTLNFQNASNFLGTLTQADVNIYGSSRLGKFEEDKAVAKLTFSATYDANGRFVVSGTPTLVESPSNSSLINGNIWSYYSGQKSYELTNHLGNVLATVSDKKIAVDDRTVANVMVPDGTVDYYKPLTTSAQNYYAFGSVQPNANNLNASSYRSGFNGMEKDDEVKTNGNSVDFGDRMYDPRLGRWMARDKLEVFYPAIAPYTFVANSPIYYIDHNGMGVFPSKEALKNRGKTVIKKTNYQMTEEGTTFCNFGTQDILHGAQDKSLDNKKANDIGNYLRNKAYATEVTQEDALRYANMGVTVIASYLNPNPKKSGHVAVVAADVDLINSTSFNQKVVSVYNVGESNGIMKLSDAFSTKHRPKLFILNSDLRTLSNNGNFNPGSGQGSGNLDFLTPIYEMVNSPQNVIFSTKSTIDTPHSDVDSGPTNLPDTHNGSQDNITNEQTPEDNSQHCYSCESNP